MSCNKKQPSSGVGWCSKLDSANKQNNEKEKKIEFEFWTLEVKMQNVPDIIISKGPQQIFVITLAMHVLSPFNFKICQEWAP